MKKILFVANYKRSVGGISGQVEILLRHLDNRTIKAELFNTKISNFRRLVLPFSLLIKGIKFDIFHIHGCSFKGFFPIMLGVTIGKLLRKRIIITYHGGGLGEFVIKHRRLVKYFITKADTITVPSKYLKNVFSENGCYSILLPNIIREDNVLFLNRKDIKPNMIVTRSFDSVYNIPLAIEVYSKIKKKYSEASLRIVGDGSERETLQTLVKKLKLDDVYFVGRVSNDNIGVELNQADIFINPTTKDSFSVSMFEAFACGLPVVSTNVGAIPEFVTDCYNGLLVNSNDCKNMEKKIDLLLNNQKLASEIAKNAYKTFLKYTWKELKVAYNGIYNFEKNSHIPTL